MNNKIITATLKGVIGTLQLLVSNLEDGQVVDEEQTTSQKQPPKPVNVTGSYDYAAIRELLTDGFTEGDLRRFTQQEPSFKKVYDSVGQLRGKLTLVEAIIEYAERYVCEPTLLGWAKSENPNRYGNDSKYVY